MEAQAKRVMQDARDLCMKAIPTLSPAEIEAMLELCAKNEGLALWPNIEEPDTVFAFFRYWPALVDVVEAWNIGLLNQVSLRRGPILHVAALVTPWKGYRLTRELIRELNPMAVTCHRYKKGAWAGFHLKINHRFEGGRVNADIQ
jgi:hypothetical protein